MYAQPTPRPARIVVATDGSSLGNPGPGGWGWYADDNNWKAGAVDGATNNQMELRAILEALRSLPNDVDLEILADSAYSINAVTVWLDGWRRRGWKNSKGDPVANRELIEAIDHEITIRRRRGVNVTFTHVKGHAGHHLNEAVDTRAREAAESLRDGWTVNEGPGWTTDHRSFKGQDTLF